MEDLKRQKEALDQLERKTGNPGAVPRTPKQQLLDLSAAQKENPDKHLRWVNIKNPEKAEARMLEGYERLPVEKGGKQLGGELAVFATSKERADARRGAQDQRTRELLVAHRGEMERVVESTARMLRDRHGIQVDEKRLLVNEE